MLAKPYVLRLVHAFCAIEDMKLRCSLAQLAEYMAGKAAPRRMEADGNLIDAGLATRPIDP